MKIFFTLGPLLLFVFLFISFFDLFIKFLIKSLKLYLKIAMPIVSGISIFCLCIPFFGIIICIMLYVGVAIFYLSGVLCIFVGLLDILIWIYGGSQTINMNPYIFYISIITLLLLIILCRIFYVIKQTNIFIIKIASIATSIYVFIFLGILTYCEIPSLVSIEQESIQRTITKQEKIINSFQNFYNPLNSVNENSLFYRTFTDKKNIGYMPNSYDINYIDYKCDFNIYNISDDLDRINTFYQYIKQYEQIKRPEKLKEQFSNVLSMLNAKPYKYNVDALSTYSFTSDLTKENLKENHLNAILIEYNYIIKADNDFQIIDPFQGKNLNINKTNDQYRPSNGTESTKDASLWFVNLNALDEFIMSDNDSYTHWDRYVNTNEMNYGFMIILYPIEFQSFTDYTIELGDSTNSIQYNLIELLNSIH